MQIRTPNAADFEAWQTLRRQLWDFVTEADNRAHFAGYQAGEHLILLAESDGAAIGFLEASIRTDYVEGCETNRVGYIEGWFVAENYRLQNVGSQLVEAAESWARELACTEMASDCDMDNLTSLKAHLAVGYEEMGRNIHFKKNL